MPAFSTKSPPLDLGYGRGRARLRLTSHISCLSPGRGEQHGKGWGCEGHDFNLELAPSIEGGDVWVTSLRDSATEPSRVKRSLG